MKQSNKEFITLQCPFCGAPLHAKKDQKFIKCDYCNHMFVIPDFKENVNIANAEQAGYDFEKGRQRAQREAAHSEPCYQGKYSPRNSPRLSGQNHSNQHTLKKEYNNNSDQKWIIRITLAIMLGLIIIVKECSSCVFDMASDAPNTSEATSTIEAGIPTEGHYNITNSTGEKILSLFIYHTGSSDKGQNYAESGMDDGASIKVDVKVDEKYAPGYLQTVEFTTESGDTENSFQTLSLEEADFSLVKTADLNSSATKQNVTFNKDVSAVIKTGKENTNSSTSSLPSPSLDSQITNAQSNYHDHANEMLNGHGISDIGREAPDYIDMIGYAVVYGDSSYNIEESDQFQNTDLWQVPTYTQDKQFWNITGYISHKTQVVVRRQELTHDGFDFYSGYLLVERMDDHSQCWIDVGNFSTKPYWTYTNDLSKAAKAGIFIAEYHQVSVYYPVDRSNRNAQKMDIPDGSIVLVTEYMETSTDGICIQGKVLGNWQYGYGMVDAYFNPKDLTIIY